MIDLLKFCGTDPTCPYIHKPFSFAEFTFATNGHILVRVPRVGGAEEGNKIITLERATKALALDGAHDFIPLPPFSFPPNNLDVDCDACNGRGTEHDCPECECTCEECDGTGKVAIKRSISLRGVAFNASYIEILLSLPGIMVAQPVPAEAPLCFKFDDGIGSLMPMRHARGADFGELFK